MMNEASTQKIDKSRYLEIDVLVRYWEDSRFNGNVDFEGKMPLRNGDHFSAIIEILGGKILNWPPGNQAEITYKVSKEGQYWLLDENKKRILKWSGDYVPDNILCVDACGLGEYMCFFIQENGNIFKWKNPILNQNE